jgi:amino acid transporter
MHALAVSSLVFALVFAGSLVGMVIRRAAPETHFAPEAKDTIRLAIGLVVTMTGLVLGMLVSSAKTFYDGEKSQVAEMASQIILMNDLLLGYGPETKQARVEALGFVEDAADRIWPKEKSKLFQLRPASRSEDFYKELQVLVPRNDAQASAKAQLVALNLSLKKGYWLMYLQTVQTPIPTPLLMVVTSWLVAIFISFGIFAPRNFTVIVTLIVCAMAVSAAIFIILSMYSPFSGILKISPAAVRDAVHQMGRQP